MTLPPNVKSWIRQWLGKGVSLYQRRLVRVQLQSVRIAVCRRSRRIRQTYRQTALGYAFR